MCAAAAGEIAMVRAADHAVLAAVVLASASLRWLIQEISIAKRR